MSSTRLPCCDDPIRRAELTVGLDVRLFRDRIAQPVSAVTMFAVTGTTALLTLLGDRTHLSEELKNQEGT